MYVTTPNDHISHDLSYFSGPKTSGAAHIRWLLQQVPLLRWRRIAVRLGRLTRIGRRWAWRGILSFVTGLLLSLTLGRSGAECRIASNKMHRHG
uniref:Uncharacterized protein n=1 Tax=Romanomermis culicivorax TaxID=13658 RepID=A0A915JWE2_ROMCU